MEYLREITIRAGFAKVWSQAANFVLRASSLMVLARLLEPRDFGLLAMVTVFIGVLSLVKDLGLSTAAVQPDTISDEQISTLFWINTSFGVVTALLIIASAPLLASLYNEPSLSEIAAALSLGFVFNAAGVQHAVLLQRQMRFLALSVIGLVALLGSIAVGIAMAFAGYGYWALVGMNVTLPFLWTAGVWRTTTWIPGWPRMRTGILPMLRFGRDYTLRGLVTYVTYNLDKFLLAHYWGAVTIGTYGRAYQLVSTPAENFLHSAIGGVALSALSRIKNDPVRLKRYFLDGYSLLLALMLPFSFLFALYPHEIVLISLGRKWVDVARIVPLLVPTTVVLSLITPFSWLLLSIGKTRRTLVLALVLAPLAIAGYSIGLSYGPEGVALGFSTAMMLYVGPYLAFSVRGTGISFWEILHAVAKPLVSCIVAGLFVLGLQFGFAPFLSPVPRFMLGGIVFFSIDIAMLLFVMGQKGLYADILRVLTRPSSEQSEPAES